jgi:hypothetical protein
MPDKVTIQKIELLDGSIEEQVLITHEDGSFSGMTKEAYEAQQATSKK